MGRMKLLFFQELAKAGGIIFPFGLFITIIGKNLKTKGFISDDKDFENRIVKDKINII